MIDEPENIEYSLNNVEPIPIFDTLDISSTTNRPEFASEEFGDFMELLTKWNLSDACASDILKFSCKICHDDVILLRLSKVVNYWIESMCRNNL